MFGHATDLASPARTREWLIRGLMDEARNRGYEGEQLEKAIVILVDKFVSAAANRACLNGGKAPRLTVGYICAFMGGSRISDLFWAAIVSRVAEMSPIDEETATEWTLDDLREPDWYDPFELTFDILVEAVGSKSVEDESLQHVP